MRKKPARILLKISIEGDMKNFLFVVKDSPTKRQQFLIDKLLEKGYSVTVSSMKDDDPLTGAELDIAIVDEMVHDMALRYE